MSAATKGVLDTQLMSQSLLKTKRFRGTITDTTEHFQKNNLNTEQQRESTPENICL